jgi:hypothetical protein
MKKEKEQLKESKIADDIENLL